MRILFVVHPTLLDIGETRKFLKNQFKEDAKTFLLVFIYHPKNRLGLKQLAARFKGRRQNFIPVEFSFGPGIRGHDLTSYHLYKKSFLEALAFLKGKAGKQNPKTGF